MNTIKYINPKTGEEKTAKVGQGGTDWIDQTGQRNDRGALPTNHSRRRLTVAEADKAMLAQGYVRANSKAARSMSPLLKAA